MSTCPKKKFFPVNMKISCLFSRFVGISLELWHLKQRINTDGTFRIFCHANRFKKYVAALTSQVHCVKNVVQHARIIHMPCLYFLNTGKHGETQAASHFDIFTVYMSACAVSMRKWNSGLARATDSDFQQ